MENRENKTIADKINSLDKLPEGYHPNLDAKWALLQSKENRPKVIALFNRKNLSKIAAILLILLISTAIWINSQKSPVNNFTVVEPKEIPSGTINTDHQNLSATVIQKPDNKKQARNKSASAFSNKKDNSVSVQEISSEKQLPAQEQAIELIPTVEEPEIAVTETKKSRERYVQMDFDDAIKSDSDKNTFAQGFQFRLGLKNQTPANKNSDGNTNFKLKRNF
jgi:hypothetical protein